MGGSVYLLLVKVKCRTSQLVIQFVEIDLVYQFEPSGKQFDFVLQIQIVLRESTSRSVYQHWVSCECGTSSVYVRKARGKARDLRDEVEAS